MSVCCTSYAQENSYQLQFKIKGLQDTTVFLGNYFEGRTYSQDTAHVTKNGEFTFDGNKTLNQGVYFLAVKRENFDLLMDLVIGTDQHFTLETDTAGFYIDHMKVIGDPDNEAFFNFKKFSKTLFQEKEPYMKIIQDSLLKDESAKKSALEAASRIDEKMLAYQTDLFASQPDLLTSRLLKAYRPIKIPDPPLLENGKPDSTFQYKYYRAHYFDNLNLADAALIHIPTKLYADKVKDYLGKMIPPDPDSVAHAIDALAITLKKNHEMYKFFILTCLGEYQASELMGMDEVFVYLYDKYVATGEMDPYDETVKQNIKKLANDFRKSLVGKRGANLILQDMNGTMRSMYDIKTKYTILWIYDPECSHCKAETPKLVDWFNKTKYNVGVYTVSIDSSFSKSKNFIKEFKMEKFTNTDFYVSAVGHYKDLYEASTTPSLYILDTKHEIVGKKISPDRLEEFFENYERVLKNRQELKSKAAVSGIPNN